MTTLAIRILIDDFDYAALSILSRQDTVKYLS